MKTEKQLLDESLLWLSAEHWLENWTHPENASTAWVKCACCREYYRKYFAKELGCPGCPIREHTGKSYCEGTPYYDADGALPSNCGPGSREEFQEEFPEHAEAMHALRSYLASGSGEEFQEFQEEFPEHAEAMHALHSYCASGSGEGFRRHAEAMYTLLVELALA